MSARFRSTALLQIAAVIALIAMLLPLPVSPARAADEEPLAIASFTCDWLSWDQYTLAPKITLTAPVDGYEGIIIRSNRPDILYGNIGQNGFLISFHEGMTEAETWIYRDWIRHPAVDTEVTLYAFLGDQIETCTVVIPSTPAPALTLKSLTCGVNQNDGYLHGTLELEGGPATPEMLVPVTFSMPEMVQGPSGFYFFGGDTSRDLRWNAFADVIDVEVTMTATWQGNTVSCTFVIPARPATATPTISPAAIESVRCWMAGGGGTERAISVNIILSEPAVADTEIRVSTDRPDIVIMPESGSLWALFRAGQTTGGVSAEGLYDNPVEDTVVTMTAYGANGEKSCQITLEGTHETPTVTPTKDLTPSATPSPTATRTPIPPPALESLDLQVSSRGGNRTRIIACLDRPSPYSGFTVTMTSDRPELVPVLSTFWFNKGQTCQQDWPVVLPVRYSALVTITATDGGTTLTESTLVRPVRPIVYTQVGSRALGQSKVTVCDKVRASEGGTQVGLSSSHPDIFPVPGSVEIPAGSACRSITVPVGFVPSRTEVTITATFGNVTRTGMTVVRRMGAPEPPTATPTESVEATSTSEPTATETIEATPTETSTATIEPSVTETVDPTLTPTPTAIETETPIPTDTPADVPTVAETETPVPTATSEPGIVEAAIRGRIAA